jgi:kinesin family protein 6/9
VQNEIIQKVTVDSASLIRRYEKEIRDLKLELAMHDTLVGRGRISYEPYTLEEQTREQNRAMAFLKNEIEDIEIHSIRQVKELFFQFKNIHHSFFVKGNRMQTQKTLTDQQTIKESGNPEPSKESHDQIENKKGVGTLNQQFGFSIGKAGVNSRPPETLEKSFFQKKNQNKDDKENSSKWYIEG